MIPMTLAEIAAATGGVRSRPSPPPDERRHPHG